MTEKVNLKAQQSNFLDFLSLSQGLKNKINATEGSKRYLNS